MATYINHPAAIFVSALGGASHGFAQSITSGVIEESPWKDMSDFLRGFISSSMLIGAAIGCTLGGFFSDKFGPKKVLIVSSIAVIICGIVQAIQSHVGVFIAFRLLSGFPVGVIQIVAPLYASEQSSAKRRGTVVSLYQLTVTFSIFIAYTINYLFNPVHLGWKYELAFTTLFPLIFTVGLFFFPESKRWEEDHKLQKQHASEKSNSGSGNSSFFAKLVESAKGLIVALLSSKRAFIVGFILSIFQQLTGINAIIMYSPNIVEKAGLTTMSYKLLATMGVGFWNFITTLIAVFLVDVFGRVPLLITGFSLMGLGHFMVVLSTIIKSLAEKMFSLQLPGMAIFLLGFEIGPGPIFYVMVSELYPQEYRGRAMSVISVFNWIANIIITFCYFAIVNALTVKWLFTIFCILCIFMVVFIVVAVPETKGRSLESISGDEKNGPEQGNETHETKKLINGTKMSS
ncbi:putative Sugar Porter (SP) Family MFS Transporter [Monocercomonoides exilis]|uniref:putative Sugar Porter (SP) Family MFS Transporter n=1 Tax=Monocercomonoides exilis TaxID=2049356 RepID=UPI00355A1204|nr:putative Sugar Porter (SP) Family MFS Transporter [Monocercomonoides exilis]|eukprot:MONOS_920.1-p1 / transcript=MONOS_920.1 / gene=MONOS_920 / organism=Monocercomonoides_exilis_PA203 / gene_product=Sugar Porter (SP) Family MFS Transporter / transcript_product=Sugar Porter (SP) Family MFS Transporter / location=Mono_scaffold00015:143704-145725(+) / protein_length=459 / sequence_SO=supercontig / SO=protein_coding / is_pseudo=false